MSATITRPVRRATRPADQTGASFSAATAFLARSGSSAMVPAMRSAYEIAMVAR